MSATNTVLTDVAEQIWLDQFTLSEADGPKLAGSADWSVTKRTLRGGPSEGVDVVDLNNGALSVSVLPTRGMGIWRANYGDVRLGWDSPVSGPVNPSFVNLTERSGLGWLTGFNELLCRCGLASHGAPGLDVVTSNTGDKIETPLTLHGKIANTPAHRVQTSISTEGDGTISVTGIVDETMLFGPCLRLTSTLSTAAGSNRFTIVDDVTNLSGQAAEMELLYHTNFGPPLLEEGSQFLAPLEEVAPCNGRAAEGIDHWQTYLAPTTGYVEQCYFMELLGDGNDTTLVLLKNAAGDKGVSLHFNRRQLPSFTIWKNTQAEADGYVTGLEPSTSLPNLKTFEREQGRVVNLKPGETYRSELELAVYDSRDAVAAVEQQISKLQEQRPLTVHPKPISKYSPAE